MTTITATPMTVLAEETPPPVARRRRRRIRWGTWITLAVISLFGFAPVYWLLATSLTPSDQVFAFPPTLFPKEVTFAHYATVFGNEAIFVYFRNSVIVSVITAVLSVIVAMYMGYAFSKYRFAGRKSLMYFVLSSQMFPRHCCS